MAKLRFTNQAISDLAQIWSYTFNNWSEKQADIYYRMLIESCTDLASNPESGKRYPEINNDLQGIKAGRHIIFYHSIESNEVEIIRILHEQMDLKRRLKTNNPI